MEQEVESNEPLSQEGGTDNEAANEAEETAADEQISAQEPEATPTDPTASPGESNQEVETPAVDVEDEGQANVEASEDQQPVVEPPAEPMSGGAEGQQAPPAGDKSAKRSDSASDTTQATSDPSSSERAGETKTEKQGAASSAPASAAAPDSAPSKAAAPDSAPSKAAAPSSAAAPPSKTADASAAADTFSFADYDIIGMDLDCTLTRFNTEALMKNVYLGLMRYLVNVKEYDKILLTEKEYGWDEGKSFLQRGLVLDAQKGNVVKLDADGGVIKAAHGKAFLSGDELKKAYGDERSTAIFKDYAKTFREVAGTIYCVQDIFILPALLANANLVQLQDKNKAASGKDTKEGKTATGNYKTWADVFAGLLELYRRERFADKTGEFFSAILVDTKTYVKPTTDKFKSFMKNLRKEKKILYLLTGSNFDYTNFLCEYAIGKDWKEYFDTVICHAGKPGFFTGIRPFYVSGRNVEITDPINHLARGEVYMMGNWRDLYAWFTKQLDKKDARAVYIGDNMVLDIISAAKFTNCKAIAVMEELDPSYSQSSANKWGSIFADKTLWATMLRRYSLIAVPSIDTLAENPLDHRYKTFTDKQDGYHPPVSAIAPVPK